MEGSRCLLAQSPALFLQNANEDVIEEVVHGPHSTIYRVRVQVHQANNSSQCWSEVRIGLGGGGFKHPGTQDDQGESRTQTQIWGLP